MSPVTGRSPGMVTGSGCRGTVAHMRVKRLALLSGVAATIGGLVWWKKSRNGDDFAEEETLLDLSSENGSAPVTEAERASAGQV